MVEIRKIERHEFQRAMEIAWETFSEFEAKIYTKEGIKSFYDFINDPILEKMFLMGQYLVFGAFLEDRMVGIAGIRNRNHLSLLFVESKYHKMGIGNALVSHALCYCYEIYKEKSYTVNAAPYAVGFYHKLGFQDVSGEVEKDGVIYTPMIYYIGT